MIFFSSSYILRECDMEQWIPYVLKYFLQATYWLPMPQLPLFKNIEKNILQQKSLYFFNVPKFVHGI